MKEIKKFKRIIQEKIANIRNSFHEVHEDIEWGGLEESYAKASQVFRDIEELEREVNQLDAPETQSAEPIDVAEILSQIKKNVKKNNYEWDLTDDERETVILCYEELLYISDLTINPDDEVSAIVPLRYFSGKTLQNILKQIISQ